MIVLIGHMLMKAPAPPASDCDGEDPALREEMYKVNDYVYNYV